MTAYADPKLPRRFGVSATAGHEVQGMDEAQEAYFRDGPSLYREHTLVTFNTEATGGADCYGLIKVGADGKSVTDDGWPFLQFNYDITAGFDAGEPSLCEGNDDLVLYMPAFRATSTITVAPMTSRDATWKIGWVMACSRYRVRIHYGSRISPDDFRHGGTALWECPYINMSCSDEVSMPWHDLRSVTPEIRPESRTQSFEVVMASLRENVFKPVPLHLTIDGGSKLDAYYLKSDEEYFAWLVAENTKSHSYFVMKTVVWARKYRLPIATLYPRGSRALREFKLVKTATDKKNWPLPEWALRYPFLSQDVGCKFYPADRSVRPRYLSGCPCKVPYYVPARNYELVWKDERLRPSLHEKDIELVQSFYGVASVKGSLGA